MNRGIYAAAGGMVASQRSMDVVANNLANALTPGYKRDEVAFAEEMERVLYANGGTGGAIGTMGTGPIERAQYTVFDVGQVEPTGNALDFAIRSPEGAFAVRTPEGIRYTRNGSFQLNLDGLLLTKDGHPVLDSTLNVIQIPAGHLEVESDGRLHIDGREIAQLGVFRGDFYKVGGTLLNSGNAQAVEVPDVIHKALEGSNVQSIHEMIELIRVNRSFELSQRAVQQQDDSSKALFQILTGA